jgi:dCTP deaminase
VEEGEMILSEIEVAMRMVDPDPERRIVITPIIDARAQFQPASFDLRLGTHFKIIRNVMFEYLDALRDPEEVGRDVERYTEDVHIPPDGKFVLHPNEFALGCTLEYVKLPNDIAGRLEGRSSWGRVGLQIHSTAGFVDPGFEGVLTFELQNVGKVPIPLYPGIRVAQISFYYAGESAIPYKEKAYSKYSGKSGTVGSLYYKDVEFEVLRRILSEIPPRKP